MATFPSSSSSATLNYQLTAYAQGLWNDLGDVIKLAERLAPSTPVPGASGQFKKFDDKNSFRRPKTARALGGDPNLIAFAASDDTFSCKPQALEVRVDLAEDQAAGSAGGEVQTQLLDQGKIRALLNQQALGHVGDVVDAVVAATTAEANIGNWDNPDIDPIDQLDQVILALTKDCGSTQNIKLTMDIASWNLLRNHPLVKKRTAFTQVANLTAAQLAEILIIPVDLMIANIVNDTAALGQAPAKNRIMSGTAIIHYSVPNATLYDPSAFKCFTVGAAGSFIGNIRTYQAPNQLWRGHLVDWSRDIKQTSTLSMRRINVTAASGK
jgi:hypothetical protein